MEAEDFHLLKGRDFGRSLRICRNLESFEDQKWNPKLAEIRFIWIADITSVQRKNRAVIAVNYSFTFSSLRIHWNWASLPGAARESATWPHRAHVRRLPVHADWL